MTIKCDAVSDINALKSVFESKAFATCLFKEYIPYAQKETLIRTSHAPPALSSSFPKALSELGGEAVEIPRPAIELTNISHLEVEAIHALLAPYSPSRVYIKRQLQEGLPVSSTVTFASKNHALIALQALHDTSLDGKRIGVFYRELIDPCVLVKDVRVSDEELRNRLSPHLSLLEIQSLNDAADTIRDTSAEIMKENSRDVLLRFGSDHDANIAVMALNGRPDMKDVILSEAIRRDTGDIAVLIHAGKNVDYAHMKKFAEYQMESSRYDGTWHMSFPSVAQAREAMGEILRHATDIQLQSPPTLIARPLYALEIDGLSSEESVSSLLLKLHERSPKQETKTANWLKASRNALLITKRHDNVEIVLRALRKMRTTPAADNGAEVGEKMFKNVTRYIPIAQQDDSSEYDVSISGNAAKDFEDHMVKIVNPSDIKRPFDDDPAVRYAVMLNAFEERLVDAVTQEDTDLFFGDHVYHQLHPNEENSTVFETEDKKSSSKNKKVIPQALITEALSLLQEASSPYKAWQAGKDITKPIPSLLPQEKFQRLFTIFQHLPENIASAEDFSDLNVLFGPPVTPGGEPDKKQSPLSWSFSMYSADFEPRLPDALKVKRVGKADGKTDGKSDAIREELRAKIRENLTVGMNKASEVLALEDQMKEKKIKEKEAKEREKMEAMGMILPSSLLSSSSDVEDEADGKKIGQEKERNWDDMFAGDTKGDDSNTINSNVDNDDDDIKLLADDSDVDTASRSDQVNKKIATTEKAQRNQIIQNRKQLLLQEKLQLRTQVAKEEASGDRKGENQFNPTILRDAEGRVWSGTILNTDMTQKTLPGGRLASHRALVVIGNLRGTAGYGMGKGNEPNDAIDNAFRDALKNLVHIDLYDNFGFAHDLHGKHNSCHAYITATPRSRVMVASDFAREVLYKFGIGSASVKLVGRRNPYSMIRAMFQAIEKHENIDEFAKARGKRYLTLKWLKDQQL